MFFKMAPGDLAPSFFGGRRQLGKAEIFSEKPHAVRAAPFGSIEPAHVAKVSIEAEDLPLGLLQIDDSSFYALLGIQAQKDVLWVKAIVREPMSVNLAEKPRHRADDLVPHGTRHCHPFT